MLIITDRYADRNLRLVNLSGKLLTFVEVGR